MQLLGDYEVVRPIARGGMGSVLEVRHSRTKQSYAAKVILKCQDPAARDRFLREAHLLARCDRHPGVVKIHSVGEAPGGLLYMVLDLVKGGDLSGLLDREHRLDASRAAALAREVAAALAFVHSLGVVHRDVKPSNVLLDEQGHAHLTDFGVATANDLERLTRTGLFIGTLRFVAPEQASGAKVTAAADIYALGCLLYRALAGEHVSENLDGTVYLAWLASALPAPDVRLLAPLAPEPLARIVAKCLEKDPLRRYESGRALADDLARFLEGRPVLAAARRTRTPLVAASAALVLAGLGAAFALAWGESPAVSKPEPAVVESAAARLERAKDLLAKRDAKGALAAIEGLDETPAVLEVVGDAAMVTSAWREAAAAYSKAMAKNPALRVKRCEAAALAGDEKTSSGDLRSLLADGARDPRVATALYRRAMAGSDTEARRRDFEMALLLAPPHTSMTKAVALAINEVASDETRRWSDGVFKHVALTDADIIEFHGIYALLTRAYALDRDLPRAGFTSLETCLRGLQKILAKKRLRFFAETFLKDWPDEPLWLWLEGYALAAGTAAERESALACYYRACDDMHAPPPDETDDEKKFAADVGHGIIDVARSLGVPADLGRVERLAARSEQADLALRIARQWSDRHEYEKALAALKNAKTWKRDNGDKYPGHVLLDEELAILWEMGKRPEVLRRAEKNKGKGDWGLRTWARYARLEGHWSETLASVDEAEKDPFLLVCRATALEKTGRHEEALVCFKRIEGAKVSRDELDQLKRLLGIEKN